MRAIQLLGPRETFIFLLLGLRELQSPFMCNTTKCHDRCNSQRTLLFANVFDSSSATLCLSIRKIELQTSLTVSGLMSNANFPKLAHMSGSRRSRYNTFLSLRFQTLCTEQRRYDQSIVSQVWTEQGSFPLSRYPPIRLPVNDATKRSDHVDHLARSHRASDSNFAA